MPMWLRKTDSQPDSLLCPLLCQHCDAKWATNWLTQGFWAVRNIPSAVNYTARGRYNSLLRFTTKVTNQLDYPFCSSDGRSYSCRALDWCPVTSRINLSGIPALKSTVAPVARKRRLLFFSEIPASLHKVSLNLRSFSFPTGAHSYQLSSWETFDTGRE